MVVAGNGVNAIVGQCSVRVLFGELCPVFTFGCRWIVAVNAAPFGGEPQIALFIAAHGHDEMAIGNTPPPRRMGQRQVHHMAIGPWQRRQRYEFWNWMGEIPLPWQGGQGHKFFGGMIGISLPRHLRKHHIQRKFGRKFGGSCHGSRISWKSCGSAAGCG